MPALKFVFEPGSLGFLALVMLVGIVARARWRGRERAARLWMRAWIAIYVILSLPITARLLTDGLATGIAADAQLAGRDAVILLSGSARRYMVGGEAVDVVDVETRLRVLEAARVHDAHGRAPIVLTGAGEGGTESRVVRGMYAALLESGVPADRIVLESDSRTTHDSAVALRALFAARGWTTGVLVTSEPHVRRSLRTFRGAGLDVVAASARQPARRLGNAWHFVPRTDALLASQSCLHEYIGIVYYWMRGWA